MSKITVNRNDNDNRNDNRNDRGGARKKHYHKYLLWKFPRFLKVIVNGVFQKTNLYYNIRGYFYALDLRIETFAGIYFRKV